MSLLIVYTILLSFFSHIIPLYMPIKFCNLFYGPIKK